MNIGLAGILTILFVVAKLVGLIAWPWWWVLSPIWISLLLTLVFLGIYGAFAAYVLKRATT